MVIKVLFAPKQSEAVMEIARSLTPAGFELVVADIGTPLPQSGVLASAMGSTCDLPSAPV